MLYTESHEWVKVHGQIATIGISNWAQKELGEIVFVELPELEIKLNHGDLACVLESTKAAADIYCPLSGKIVEVNQKLKESPNLINASPENSGWVFKIKMQDLAELDKLMTHNTYYKLVTS